MTEAYPFVMFMALVALFSPLAALSAFMPVVGHFTRGDQRRLAAGLFVNVAIFVLAAVWLGEPLLRLLGVSTAALTVMIVSLRPWRRGRRAVSVLSVSSAALATVAALFFFKQKTAYEI